MMSKKETNPKREQNGQYAYHNNWERLCVCGHSLGDHCIGSPKDCMVSTMSPDYLPCDCQQFRLSRKKGNK